MNGQVNLDLPGIMPSANERRFRQLIRRINNAPNEHLKIGALRTCLEQVWPLIPEGDEELFFDNIQAVERQAKKWSEY